MTRRFTRRHRRSRAWRFGVPSHSPTADLGTAIERPAILSPETLAGAGDHELLYAVGGGSAPALQELLHRHGYAVHALADLLAHDVGTVDALVLDVFLALAQRFGHMEDGVANVRLGLMAMARRRSPRSDHATAGQAGAGEVEEVGAPTPLRRLRCLPRKDREPVALTVMTKATLTEVALVLGADRDLVASRLRSGLLSAWAAAAPSAL